MSEQLTPTQRVENCTCESKSTCDCDTKQQVKSKREILRATNIEILMLTAEWAALKEEELKAQLKTASVLKKLRCLEYQRSRITYES